MICFQLAVVSTSGIRFGFDELTQFASPVLFPSRLLAACLMAFMIQPFALVLMIRCVIMRRGWKEGVFHSLVRPSFDVDDATIG